jgi:hypothetical protein
MNTRIRPRFEQRQRMADDRRMKTASRPQRRNDHQLRDLVRPTGDLTITTELGVPRSTARGWLAEAPTVVISVDGANRTEAELRQEILKLRQRVGNSRRCSGWPSPCYTPPGSGSQAHVCRTEKPSCGSCAPWIGLASVSRLRVVLRFRHLSPSRFQAWRRRQTACALEDRSSCPRTAPHQLMRAEVDAIRDTVTAPEHRHVSTGTLAVLAQRLNTRGGVAVDRVPPRADVRLATPAASDSSGEAKGGATHERTRRDMEHRHDGHPATRWDTSVSARRDRQLLTTDSGLACGRHLRTGQ